MRLRILPVLAIALASATGCYPYHRGYHHHHDDDGLIDACLFTTCIADTCLFDVCEGPHEHRYVDAPRHHHGPNCGCPARWDHGQYIYYYEGHWEYEDGAGCPW